MECKYRNCEKLTEGRKDKEFCCLKCKRNEAKYRQRSKKKLLGEIEVQVR